MFDYICVYKASTLDTTNNEIIFWQTFNEMSLLSRKPNNSAVFYWLEHFNSCVKINKLIKVLAKKMGWNPEWRKKRERRKVKKKIIERTTRDFFQLQSFWDSGNISN